MCERKGYDDVLTSVKKRMASMNRFGIFLVYEMILCLISCIIGGILYGVLMIGWYLWLEARQTENWRPILLFGSQVVITAGSLCYLEKRNTKQC